HQISSVKGVPRVTQLKHRFQNVRNLSVHKNQTVFLADDFLLERTAVVVRVFRRRWSIYNLEFLSRCFSWHQGVSDAHLSRILDCGITDANESFYVREYIQPSQELFQDPTHWIRGLLATVRFLHQNSRIHGSLKPSNLFIQHGLLKIADPKVFPTSNHTIEDT